MCARLLAAAALGAAVLSGAAGAHHGWGSYDSTRPLTLDGVVSEVMPDNPHAGLLLEVEGRVWQVTLSPPIGPALGQRGGNIMEFCQASNAQPQALETRKT